MTKSALSELFQIGKQQEWESLLIISYDLIDLPIEVFRLSSLKRLIMENNSFSWGENNHIIGSSETIFLFEEEYKLEYGRSTMREKQLYFHALPIKKFRKISPKIAELTKLEVLQIFGSPKSLKNIPSEIKNLHQLEELYIPSKSLNEIPSEIGSLKNLQTITLSYNQITSIPVEITKLKNLQTLDLRGNLLPIPPEILEKTNEPKTILNYYFQTTRYARSETAEDRTIPTILEISRVPDKTAIKPINEVKLIFVGQGSVGKTSIIQQIQYGVFQQNQTKTEGISINQWKYNINQERKPKFSAHLPTQFDASKPLKITYDSQIKINIWDFGGQEIMHATHQFFLTKRSLYLLVLDSRLTQEENRVEYWLKIIQSFGGESPVLIVGNKIDQHPLDIDSTGLQKKYPNILGIYETSAATGVGIEELKAAVIEQVNNLPHIRDLLPETWFTVKTTLEELGQKSNFITHDKYLELCAENEVNDETSQRTLIGFLHDLGLILYFQEDYRLAELGILNPQWVTNGVYKIINSDKVFKNKGVLTATMLDEILNFPEYPRSKRLSIVDLMKRFELCFEIESDKAFLIPDLLPKDKPSELNFVGTPVFEYMYPVFTSKVITRFIVRMNQKIDDGIVWRTGVLLKIGDNRALVKADIEDRKITIAIDGLEHTRRDALSAIRYQLDEIHASIKGLDARKRVPIPNAPNAEPLEYDYLLMLERERQETHLVKDGTRLVKVNIHEILSGIESESQVKERGGNVTNIYVGGNVRGNIIAGDDNVAESSSDTLHPS